VRLPDLLSIDELARDPARAGRDLALLLWCAGPRNADVDREPSACSVAGELVAPPVCPSAHHRPLAVAGLLGLGPVVEWFFGDMGLFAGQYCTNRNGKFALAHTAARQLLKSARGRACGTARPRWDVRPALVPESRRGSRRAPAARSSLLNKLRPGSAYSPTCAAKAQQCEGFVTPGSALDRASRSVPGLAESCRARHVHWDEAASERASCLPADRCRTRYATAEKPRAVSRWHRVPRARAVCSRRLGGIGHREPGSGRRSLRSAALAASVAPPVGAPRATQRPCSSKLARADPDGPPDAHRPWSAGSCFLPLDDESSYGARRLERLEARAPLPVGTWQCWRRAWRFCTEISILPRRVHAQPHTGAGTAALEHTMPSPKISASLNVRPQRACGDAERAGQAAARAVARGGFISIVLSSRARESTSYSAVGCAKATRRRAGGHASAPPPLAARAKRLRETGRRSASPTARVEPTKRVSPAARGIAGLHR
jgi:hypothetical protein